MASAKGKRVYNSARWRKLRLAIFARDGWRCTVNVPGVCTGRGRLECDHIEPIAKGGDWFDADNLRTVCRSCHIHITAAETRKKLSADRQAFRDMAYAET